MNGINLNMNILRSNLTFIREEIARITEVKTKMVLGHDLMMPSRFWEHTRRYFQI